jgi:hypothetical protein
MEINFKGTVYIREEDVEDMARLVINGGYGIADAINEILAGYEDDVYYTREYFWDELVEQVENKMKEIKPKTRTVRFTAYIDLPIDNEDEFYELLSREEIDFNECEDIEFDEIIDED